MHSLRKADLLPMECPAEAHACCLPGSARKQDFWVRAFFRCIPQTPLSPVGAQYLTIGVNARCLVLIVGVLLNSVFATLGLCSCSFQGLLAAWRTSVT